MKYKTTQGNSTYGSTLNVSCESGYRLRTKDNNLNRTQRNDNGTETITCGETGIWSNLSGCEPKGN